MVIAYQPIKYPRTAILRPPAVVAILKKEKIHHVEYQVPLRPSCHLISMIQPPVLSVFFFFFVYSLFIAMETAQSSSLGRARSPRNSL